MSSKYTVAFLLISVFVLGIACGGPRGEVRDSEEVIRVMTFNIRYDNPDDGIHSWTHRRDRVVSSILYSGAIVVGVQEALNHQLLQLDSSLVNHTWLGVGRDDGAELGEYTAIFYDSTRVSLTDSGTFWLSETPQVPGSRSWDAAITRTATWARFESVSGTVFFVFNTHFDHVGEDARVRSAALIHSKIKEIASSMPAVLLGDFNTTENSDAYSELTADLADALYISELAHHGPKGTFHGSFMATDEAGPRLDYIFVGNGIAVKKHATLSDNWDGALASDHLAVVADVVIKDE